MSELEKNGLFSRVDRALDDVRPHLKADGGDVEIVEITDDMHVRIKWVGNCQNCFMSGMTLKAGIEQAVMAKVPEIKSIEAINSLKIG